MGVILQQEEELDKIKQQTIKVAAKEQERVKTQIENLAKLAVVLTENCLIE